MKWRGYTSSCREEEKQAHRAAMRLGATVGLRESCCRMLDIGKDKGGHAEGWRAHRAARLAPLPASCRRW